MDDDRKEQNYASCASLIVLVGALIVGVMMDGLVIPRLWEWFIVPIFGLPKLLFWQAVGIGILISYMTHQPDYNNYEDQLGHSVKMALYAIFNPLFLLLTGWIVYQFIK